MALSTDEIDQDEVRTLVHELLRVGAGLADLIGSLLDELPEDAFPGEDHALVLLDMITGTVRPVAGAAGERTVREATALLGAIGERVFADLQAAAELASGG